MHNVSSPLFVSSNPDLGAFNINTGISRFSVQFKNTIEIPPDAQNITLELLQSTIFWTVINIKEGINDLFKLITPDVGSPFTITIPPGLYAVVDLNDAISREFINLGISGDYVSLTGDNSTGRILITLSESDLQVEFITGSFFELLGFDELQIVPDPDPTTGPYSELGPNVANFSDVSSFLVHTDLVQSGIPIGNQENLTIAQVLITVPPGSQISYQPVVPIQIPVEHLRGKMLNEATFFITDQLNRDVDFNGEDFTLLLVIKYLTKIDVLS